jgi:hypothetical protein
MSPAMVPRVMMTASGGPTCRTGRGNGGMVA